MPTDPERNFQVEKYSNPRAQHSNSQTKDSNPNPRAIRETKSILIKELLIKDCFKIKDTRAFRASNDARHFAGQLEE